MIVGHYLDYAVIRDELGKLYFPLLFFVDSVTSVAENVIWMKCRKNRHDIVIDLEGNIYYLKDIIGVKSND